jgi:hypothetical protein
VFHTHTDFENVSFSKSMKLALTVLHISLSKISIVILNGRKIIQICEKWHFSNDKFLIVVELILGRKGGESKRLYSLKRRGECKVVPLLN